MAEEAKPIRTLTEDEAYAIAADRVQRETAELNTKLTGLERETADLRTKLDVSEASVATEKAARETAEQQFSDYKADQERQREVAALRGTRETKVREVASHLQDSFFTDERRDRWATMDEDQFATYVGELTDLAPAAGTVAPRQTAMRGERPAGETTGNAAKMFELRRGA